MALPTAVARRSGPVDQPGEQAYLYARAGLARSGATRSNYVPVLISIDWIVRNESGAIVSTTDLSDDVLLHTLAVAQALNDEPDTCSLVLKPRLWPSGRPTVGQEIRIAWAPGGSNGVAVFHGYIVTTQDDWRLNNLQPPWIAIQCADSMWRFDARLVTYRFPTQSVSDSIAFLVRYFCNADPNAAHALNFTIGFVQPNMPHMAAFDVVNQRPSTVMRTLTAAVGGGFYLDGLAVHAWATTVSEPNQTNPTALTVGLKTFHTFRRITDATQIRRRVLVEGRRTDTLISWPTLTPDESRPIGLPIGDATLFNLTLPDQSRQLTRIGTQWVFIENPVSVAANGAQPPQTQTDQAFDPATAPDGQLFLKPMPMSPPTNGWIRIGNQTMRYSGVFGDPLTDVWSIYNPPAHFPYGHLTTPVPAGTTVEWIDSLNTFHSHGLGWNSDDSIQVGSGDDLIRAQPTGTPVVTLAMAQTAQEGWPPFEGFVQDGRYSYAGAQARAESDLSTFRDPLVEFEWSTDDRNAQPGRAQDIYLTSPTITPVIQATVTILRVDLTFELRTLAPRRACYGGRVKPSTFMDLVVTTTD